MDQNMPASQGENDLPPAPPQTFNQSVVPLGQDPVLGPNQTSSVSTQSTAEEGSMAPVPQISQPQTPPSQISPELPKKSSPLFVIALVILLMTILALGGYFVYTKYLSPQVSLPVATAMPVVTPEVVPTEVPSSSPSAIPSVQASPSASSSPSGTISK